MRRRKSDDRSCGSTGRALYASPQLTVSELLDWPAEVEPVHVRQPSAGPRRFVVFPAASASIVLRGAAPFVVDSNHVLLCNERWPVRREPVAESRPRGEPDTLLAADATLLSRYASWPDPGEPDPDFVFPVARAPIDSQTYLMQAALIGYLHRHPRTDDALVGDLLANALGRVVGTAMDAAYTVRHAARDETLQERARLVEAAMRLLARDAAGDLSLDDVALVLGTSPFHLTRVFRAQTGFHLHRYRHHLRLRAALRRLAVPGPALVEIAFDLGYTSHSHLSDSFRRVFGLSPSSARRLMFADSAEELRTNLEALLAGCSYAGGSFTAGPHGDRAASREAEEEQQADATGSNR